MAAQIWDNDFGPLVVTYWATVKRIYDMTVVKATSNSATNTICNGVLAEIVAATPPSINSLHIACAAGLATNTFVGGA